MPEKALELFDLVDEALSLSDGVLDPDLVESLRSHFDLLKRRADLPPGIGIVALVGGTGSGKSSLANALVGQDLAVVGGVRPTTDRALALTPRRWADALGRYLATVGVDDQTIHDGPDQLCLLDLPDTDSIVLEHRSKTLGLIGAADIVVWVLDPEKYRDALIHSEIAARAAHQERFVFVLNQADRLPVSSLDAVVEDLRAALVADGVATPVIQVTVASQVSGPYLGMDGLLDAVFDRPRTPEAISLMLGLETGAARLASHLTMGGGTFEERSRAALEATVSGLLAGDIGTAEASMMAFVDGLAATCGGVSADALHALATRTPLLVQGVRETTPLPPAPTSTGLGSRRRMREYEARSARAVDRWRTDMSDQIVAPAREVMQRRGRAAAKTTELVMGVQRLATETGR